MITLYDFACANEYKTFRVSTYNVENLFDLIYNGTEYDEYVPGSKHCWNERISKKKYSNIAKVISELKSDIVALQEVESLKALLKLRRFLKDKGVEYPFWAIAGSNNSVVKCAVLSKFKIINYKEICAKNCSRSILKVNVDILGNELIIYVNHWQSKRNPESARIKYAKALKTEIEKLSPEKEYIILGDLNSDYNEFITFRKNVKLNDTSGRTGINHVLKTITDTKMVDIESLISSDCNRCLYNLWLEIEPENRWSYIFSGKKSSLDHIIIPESLYDQKNIKYIDNSFVKYMPAFILRGKYIYRWQKTKKGLHKGEGFSDHLPVYADFKVENAGLK